MRFPGPNGAMVPLSAVGAFKHTLGPRVIPRVEKRAAAGVVIRPKAGVSTLELVGRIEEDPPDPRKYVVSYSTMTREEVASRGKFERLIVVGLVLVYLVLVAVRESWLEPLKLIAEAFPAAAGGILGVCLCGQDFTILAQLALVFLLVFSVALALRPMRTAPFATVVSLLEGLGLSRALDVGGATFAAFAAPLSAGLFVAWLCALPGIRKRPCGWRTRRRRVPGDGARGLDGPVAL